MKIDMSKLKQTQNTSPETKIDLSKINTQQSQEETETKQGPAKLIFDKEKLKSVTASTYTAPTVVNQHSSDISHEGISPKKEDTPNNENIGFKLTFTEGKKYDLDSIVYNKRRDNANCPLILKVNLNNEYDREITKLIIVLILDDYLNADKSEESKYSPEFLSEHYEELIPKVPAFDETFNGYFNKYYSYYYNKIKQVYDGSISLNTIKSNIVESYRTGYESLLGDTLEQYGNSRVFNKPQIEYEMGTPQTEGDMGQVMGSYIGLTANNGKLFASDEFGIVEGQSGIKFPTINNAQVLDNDINFQLLTFSDYVELIQTILLITKNYKAVFLSDDYCLAFTSKVVETEDNTK